MFELIERFCIVEDLTTPDPYDVWNSKLGQSVKKVYYKNKMVGMLPSAALTIFDFYFNNKTRLGYAPRQYPIVHAFRVLICMQLYKKKPENKYVLSAAKSLKWLAQNYSRNYSGFCWGINMPWVSKIAVYDENIPHVTHTPYVLEAFLTYQSVTNTSGYNEVIDSIIMFLENDLNKIIDNPDSLALSYSPKSESRIVVNANSYSMLCYALLLHRGQFSVDHKEDKIRRLYNFIVANQHDNGSWFYFADNSPGNFIDCFHSCFVLKNIFKVNQIIPLKDSERVIASGYAYVKKYFWDDSRQLFRRFTITDRASLVKYDLYDNAEMLSLAILLNDDALVNKLSLSIKTNFTSSKNIYSHIIFPNVKINKNMLRWASMPYLYALSKTL